MNWVEITNAAADALAKAGAGRRHMKPGKPGHVIIKMDDEVLTRLETVRFPDESISDTILRIVNFQLNSGRLN
jgi:hypothetical protein